MQYSRTRIVSTWKYWRAIIGASVTTAVRRILQHWRTALIGWAITVIALAILPHLDKTIGFAEIAFQAAWLKASLLAMLVVFFALSAVYVILLPPQEHGRLVRQTNSAHEMMSRLRAQMDAQRLSPLKITPVNGHTLLNWEWQGPEWLTAASVEVHNTSNTPIRGCVAVVEAITRIGVAGRRDVLFPRRDFMTLLWASSPTGSFANSITIPARSSRVAWMVWSALRLRPKDTATDGPSVGNCYLCSTSPSTAYGLTQQPTRLRIRIESEADDVVPAVGEYLIRWNIPKWGKPTQIDIVDWVTTPARISA